MIPTVSRFAECSLYAVGLGASVQDMARRKVANRWIVAALAASALALAVMGLGTLLGARQASFLGLGTRYLPPGFYVEAGVHFLLSAAAAIALWYLRVWPAGDAKLFIALSCLLAVAQPGLRGFPNWLFLIALINIFVAAGVYVTGVVLYEWGAIAWRLDSRGASRELHAFAARWLQRAREQWSRRQNYVMVGWNTLAMFLCFSLLLSALRLRLTNAAQYLAVYLVLYFSWRWIRVLFVRKSVCRWSFFLVTLVVIPSGAYLRWGLVRHLLASVKFTAGFDVFLVSFQRVVDLYLQASRRRSVDVAQLREGMVLTQESWQELLGGEEEPRYADGLSSEDLARIERRSGARAVVYWHRPFALWIFLGCLWTLYMRENVVQWLTRLARR